MKRRIRMLINFPVSAKTFIIFTTVVLFAAGLMSFGSWALRARAKTSSNPARTVAAATEVHEVDRVLQAAVYTTKEGWNSNLLLLNAEGKAVTARVTLYNKHGQSMNISPITLEAYTSNSWDIADWVRNVGGFDEGSLTVTYFGLSMGFHAQETVSNKQRSLSFDVHLEDTIELMSPTVDGLWWGLDDRTEAKVFIANTKAAQTTVTPTFYVGGVGHQGEAIVLDPHASDAIDIGKALKRLRLSATLGGISLSSSDGPGAISAVGLISNKQRGFSTTMRFVDHHMSEGTSTHGAHNESATTTLLHGANIMIGKSSANPGFPSNTRFTPRIIVRNNTSEVVRASGRIRFTLSDQPNVKELPSITLAANEVRELDMSAVVNSIGDNSVNAGIEIDYSGQPGALMAYAASIDQSGNNAFDVPIKDPKAMAFKGGANPWNIDGENRAVLHVKNVNAPDGEKRAFTLSLYYDGGVYNMPLQLVEAGQTAEIDIRKLRDDQVPDSSGNVIPLNITRGQLSWFPRSEKGDFIGRLVQYSPEGGISSSFSCDEPCWCSYDHFSSFLVPGSFNGQPGDFFQVNAYEVLIDCYGWPHGPYHITNANFFSDNPFVADVFYQNQNAYVVLVGGGSTDIEAQWDSWITVGQTCDEWNWASGWCEVPICDYEEILTGASTSVTSQPPPPRIDSITPNVVAAGQAIQITISGANFDPGNTLVNVSDTNHIQVDPGIESSTTLIRTFHISADTPSETVNISVTVNGQTSNSKTLTIRVPHHLVVVSDNGNSQARSDCQIGQPIVRLITLRVVDVNGNPVGPVTVSENFTNLSANSCQNGDPQPAQCAYTDNGTADFTDTITVNCNAINGSCGYTIVYDWRWCPTQGGSPVAIGHFSETVHANQITINGNTSGFSPGTTISP